MRVGWFLLFLILCGSFSSLVAQSGTRVVMQTTRMVTAPAELTASDGKAGELGAALAISGNVIVLGAPDTYGGFGTSGTVYLYVEPSGGWSSMPPTADLLETGYEEYGISVAISGDTVVVGAPTSLISGSPGAAFVFVKPPGGWTTMGPTATLTDSAGLDAFGTSVAIDGDTIVVGAPLSGVDYSERGAAYVFVKPTGGWTNMTETATLTDTDGYTQQLFANSVAISGSTIVAGTGNGDQNSAYVFVEPAGGWIDMTETAELRPSDGVLGDRFGSAVGVRGNTIAVTSPAKEIGSNAGQGAAYVYVKPTGGWTNVTQTAELTASNGITASRLGQSVFVTNDSVLAGAEDVVNGHGGVCVFIEPTTGWQNMTQTSELVYPAAGGTAAWFGSSVGQWGNSILIGAPALGTNAPGAAYVFTQ